jgi:hypothetical protein
MDIYNPPSQVPYITAAGGQKLQVTVFPIGVWDMDTNAGKIVPCTITSAQSIVGLWVTIFHDNGTDSYASPYISDVGAPLPDGLCNTQFGHNFCQLRRVTGGFFDGSDFDDGVMNRGWLTIIEIV